MKKLIYSVFLILLCGNQIKSEESRLFEKQGIDFEPTNMRTSQRGNFEHLKQLETTGQCTGCDLHGFDITKAYETYKSSQRASNQEINPINVSGSNLSRSNLENGDFERGNFIGTVLESSNCQNAQFADAYLTNANFTYANCSSANFKLAHLEDANFTGATLRGANFKQSYLFILINYLGYKKDKAVFTQADLKNAEFTGDSTHYLIQDAYNPCEAIFS